MTDIRTRYISLDDGLDYLLDELGLETDDGLETAVILSLFSDRQANDTDELPTGSSDRRGWWGDDFSEVANDQIGSRLWLLRRSKQLPEVMVTAQEYAEESLQWMVDDGVASSVSVVASNPRSGILALTISIYRTGSSQPVTFKFETAWNNT